MDRKRPGPLQTVVVVGCILGGLGSCGGLTGVVGNLLQSGMQGFSRSILEASSQGNDDILRQQLEMQERVEALTAEHQVTGVGVAVLNLLASIALLAGSIQLIRWRAAGLSLFTTAAIASVVADLASGGFGIFIQLRTSSIMREHMSTVSDPGLPPGFDQTMGAMMDASASVGMCFGVLWVLAKMGFYIYGIVTVRNPAIRALYGL
jgi:hypothetical protein